MKVACLAIALVLLAAIGLGVLPDDTEATSVAICGDPTSDHMTRFIGFAHHIATSPRGDAARLSWKIPRADSAAVRLVSDETLCHTGQQLLYREAGKQPGSDSRIFMVAIDSVYWIEDPSLMSGEWLFAVVSNSSLDRVLATAAR